MNSKEKIEDLVNELNGQHKFTESGLAKIRSALWDAYNLALEEVREKMLKEEPYYDPENNPAHQTEVKTVLNLLDASKIKEI